MCKKYCAGKTSSNTPRGEGDNEWHVEIIENDRCYVDSIVFTVTQKNSDTFDAV